MVVSPAAPERKYALGPNRVTIKTRRGKITFPSVRKAAAALGVNRAKLTVFLRRKIPQNAYYVGLTPSPGDKDDDWEEMTDDERAIWNI